MQASGKAAAMRSSTRPRWRRRARWWARRAAAASCPGRQHAARQAQALALAARQVEAAFGQRACRGRRAWPAAPRRRCWRAARHAASSSSQGWPKLRFSRTLASNTSVSCGISVASVRSRGPVQRLAVDRKRAAAAAHRGRPARAAACSCRRRSGRPARCAAPRRSASATRAGRCARAIGVSPGGRRAVPSATPGRASGVQAAGVDAPRRDPRARGACQIGAGAAVVGVHAREDLEVRGHRADHAAACCAYW